nr:glycosyltransferase [uncultured Schaedlerella sp.]
MPKIMVSVFCITYNQVNYIRDTLEGFVSQKTNFPFEVIIFDDASNDGTSDIVREYEKKYPELIHPIIAKKNTFFHPNRNEMIWGIERRYLRGKYVAYCEGDDYWIDCHKLQIQVDYMEKHPECSLYLHNALRMDCMEKTLKPIDPYDGEEEKDVFAEELIMFRKGHPPTASFMHRKELIEYPKLFRESSVGDYTMLLYAITQGSVHYNSRIMSIYRWLSVGSYNREVMNNLNRAFYFYVGLVDFLFRYDNYTNYKYHIWNLCMMQIHITQIIYKCIKHKPSYEYITSCKAEGILIPERYVRYFEEFERIKKQTFEMTYVSEQTREFIMRHRNVVVMGIGKYGTIVASQLNNNNISFAGFSVTKRVERNTYMDKPVWELSQLIQEMDDVGVLIGINPESWDDIIKSLADAKIKNYYCPFLMDERNII